MIRVLAVILIILLVVSTLLLAYLGAMIVDQTIAPRELVTAVVIDRSTGTEPILVGKIFVPTRYWLLSLQVEDELFSRRVSQSCYLDTNIGDRMNAELRRGHLTTEIYPACNG